MNQPLKVLLVEDSEDDAKLALRALRGGGFEPTSRRVQTAAELEAALAEERWEVVISDFNMPSFTGLEALGILRSTGLDIPFILISGTIGEETAATVAGELTLENQLRQALDREEFVLHYQPKVNLLSGKLTGAGALIRWNDPRTGLVPAGRFIPILEDTGLIYEVGRWALRKAIEEYLRWRTAGLAAVRIAVRGAIAPAAVAGLRRNAGLPVQQTGAARAVRDKIPGPACRE